MTRSTGRSLGSTGLVVSPIGLGLAALGRPGYINLGRRSDLGPRDPESLRLRTHEMLDAAMAGGIRYVDAARSYGRAEEFLGSWLEERHRALRDPVVGSKWGYTYTAAWQVNAAVHEVKEHTLDRLDAQFTESKEHLGDHLDLYQIHSATAAGRVLEDRRVLARLGEMRDTGLAIGLTTSGPGQAAAVRRATTIVVDGTPLFATVQATWNVLETSAGAALAEAHDAGIGVIIKEALANGRLAGRDRSLDVTSLERIGAAAGTGIDAVAIAAAMARPWATVVLSGAATPDHLHANLQALEISPDQLDLPDLEEEPGAYWATRASLAWN